MKIFFFIGSMRRGGAERVISILANHYAEKNWNVEIILLLENTIEYKLNSKIKIINISANGSYIKNIPYWFKNIRKYINESKPDRIVSFVGRINMLVLTSTVGLNIPTIISERNDPKHDGRGKLMEIYANLCYKLASSIVFQTEYEKLCFSKRLYNRSYIIPNPVNVEVKRNENENIEVVTAGRLMPQKNQDMLIDAFNKISDKYPNAILDIYGDGSLKEHLQDKINSCGMQDTIKLCGNVTNIHEKISGATMFVLSSNFEGLSNALIEAMMIGLPCITTNYPGANEIVRDGYNGLVVPMNDVDALSNAMEEIIVNKELSNKLSINAIKSSEIYKKEVVIEQWEKIIEK